MRQPLCNKTTSSTDTQQSKGFTLCLTMLCDELNIDLYIWVQGIVAGLNAARRAQELSPMTLSRDSSYIGTLLDDLVTKVIFTPVFLFRDLSVVMVSYFPCNALTLFMVS